MATQARIHPGKRKRDPNKTKTGKEKIKGFSLKKLYDMLVKLEPEGKKRAKIAKEIARRTPIK